MPGHALIALGKLKPAKARPYIVPYLSHEMPWIRKEAERALVKIDKAGRIVLPKPVRERFHLREGSELELEERPDGLTLRPVEQQPSMVRKNGIWVHLGKVPRDFDWDVAVDAIREERIKDTSGA